MLFLGEEKYIISFIIEDLIHEIENIVTSIKLFKRPRKDAYTRYRVNC